MCVFATDTVEYLGHICTPLGVKPDPQKVRAVIEYLVPNTVRDIRSFVGLAGYYRRHVPNFARLAQPLTNLTKKDLPFTWTEEQQKAFEGLKHILSTGPLLIYPDFHNHLLWRVMFRQRPLELFCRNFEMEKRNPWLIVVDN